MGIGQPQDIDYDHRRKCQVRRPKAFRDRTEAGRLLADKFKAYANHLEVMVLALPRGGAGRL